MVGFWDATMLCEACEKKFSNLDSYGWKVLSSAKLTDKPLHYQFQLYGYEVDCEVEELHKFILSVFWRACASRIDAFKSFRLFKYEARLLEDIFDKKPLDTNFYQTIVFRLDKNILGEFSNVMFEPLAHPQKDGSYMCQMYLPRLKIVTFINSGNHITEWMKLFPPNKFIMPFLSASMSQQEVQFLAEWHKRFSGHRKSL